jgi:hypothetical protein
VAILRPAPRADRITQRGERGVAMIMVDIGEDKDVGLGSGDHAGDRSDLRIALGDGGQQEARPLARQFSVPEGDADRIGGERISQEGEQKEEGQTT